MHFGGHIGFLAAILDLRQNLRWPRSVFQIMWSEVHESTEKTLTGKRAVFTWLGPDYGANVCIAAWKRMDVTSNICCNIATAGTYLI